MAEKALQKDLSLSRPKFRASKEVREAMSLDPDLSGKRLAKVTKQMIRKEADNQKLLNVHRLEKQGNLSRCSPTDGAKVSAKALEAVHDEHLKFPLNSAVDTLPHNANLHL